MATVTLTGMNRARTVAELEQELAKARAATAAFAKEIHTLRFELSQALGAVQRFDVTEYERVPGLIVDLRETLEKAVRR